MLVTEVIVLSFPVLAAGLIHHFLVVRYNWLPSLKKPLDGGLTWRGRRLLGDSKTFRGFLIVTVCSGLFMFLVSPFITIPLKHSPFLSGSLLGFGYSLLELPNSFLKRRMGIREGAFAKGRSKPLWAILDQTDSVIGGLLFLPAVYTPSWRLIVVLFLVGTLLHVAIDGCLYRFGYKKGALNAWPSQ